MQKRLYNLLSFVTLIFGVLVIPATAHAEDLAEVHTRDVLAILDHTDHDGQNHDGDAPCHATVHHHCSIAVASNNGAAISEQPPAGVLIPIATSPAMSSFAQAPPTEPPSA
jgi:hypothetical protein